MTYEDLNFCLKLKTLREIRNLSMEQMANRLQLSKRMYYKIEREENDITLRRFVEICDVLDLSLLEFLSFDRKKLFTKSKTCQELERELQLTQQMMEDKEKIINQLQSEINRLSKQTSATSL